MDAVKFIEERNRMCKAHAGCAACAVREIACDKLGDVAGTDVVGIVNAVEKWSAAHPRKTRQSVFLEQYPNCMIDNDGVVGICPRNVNNKCICDLERSYDCRGCPVCRRKFWMQEVE